MRVFSVGTGLGQLQQEKTHRGDARGIGDAGHSVQCSALSKRCPPDWFWEFMWVVSMLCTSGRMPQSTYRTWEALSILNKQTLFWKPSNIYPSRENSSKNPHVPITKLQNSSAFCHSYLSFLL